MSWLRMSLADRNGEDKYERDKAGEHQGKYDEELTHHILVQDARKTLRALMRRGRLKFAQQAVSEMPIALPDTADAGL